MQTIKQMTG